MIYWRMREETTTVAGGMADFKWDGKQMWVSTNQFEWRPISSTPQNMDSNPDKIRCDEKGQPIKELTLKSQLMQSQIILEVLAAECLRKPYTEMDLDFQTQIVNCCLANRKVLLCQNS